MTELVLIVLSAVLANNFVLVKFLGLCPFFGASARIETARVAPVAHVAAPQ